jgi:SAM-dependent methyltransferase
VQATARVEQGTGPAAGYPRFHAAVALAQLTSWLPGGKRFLIDISGPGARAAEVAACAGHSVLRVIDQKTPAPPPGAAYEASGRLSTVTADGTGLEFLPDGCADGVIAEERTLSLRLAAEELVAEIARVLRPGGQVLACVDSLTFGMALLAEQHRWPHLVDVPNADVVLIPWPDGTITRCYGAEQLRELFTSSGLEVSWIRPRTVLSPQTVAYLLARDPASFGELVNAELHARSDDSVGAQLIACCVKRPLPSPAVALRLAGDAAGGRGAGFEARLGHRARAVDAPSVAAVVDPGQRGEHLGAVGQRRLHGRGVPVRLRQVRASVARLCAAAADKVVFTREYRNRSVQVGAHFLKALTGNADFHGRSSVVKRGSEEGRTGRLRITEGFDQGRAVVPYRIDGRRNRMGRQAPRSR